MLWTTGKIVRPRTLTGPERGRISGAIWRGITQKAASATLLASMSRPDRRIGNARGDDLMRTRQRLRWFAGALDEYLPGC